MRYFETPTFKAQQRAWYGKLKEEGFLDIEDGLEHARILRQAGDNTRVQLNAALDGPVVQKPGRARGREWEQLLSSTHRGVSPRHAPVGRYIHIAQLVAAQEYALCRLGPYKTAGEARAVWALHSQGTSERDMVRLLELPRYRIRKYLSVLTTIIDAALDGEADAC